MSIDREPKVLVTLEVGSLIFDSRRFKVQLVYLPKYRTTAGIVPCTLEQSFIKPSQHRNLRKEHIISLPGSGLLIEETGSRRMNRKQGKSFDRDHPSKWRFCYAGERGRLFVYTVQAP